MDQKQAAVAGKNKSGIKNEPAQEIDQVTESTLLMADSSTKGQQSGVKKTRPVVKKEARLTQEDNVVQVNSSDDLESRDAKFEKYLKDLDCKIRETLKQNPLPPNPSKKLNNHLKKLTENQMKQKEDRSKQEEQLKEQCCKLVSLLQQFCSPLAVWKWTVCKQMSHQEQKKETEQLKQLAEKYVVVIKYMTTQENMSMNMPQSLSPYKLTKVDYTSEAHINYVSKYCGKKKVLFLGMNPSKKGMELGGVPFCDEESIRNWLKVSNDANQNAPPSLNGKEGPNSTGKRFWGLVEEICGTPEVFFKDCFVRNYCPLLLLNNKRQYVSLKGMKAACREQFEPSCNQALRECVQALGVKIVVAAGVYVTKRAKIALKGKSVEVVKIPHPSHHNTKLKNVDDWKRKAKNALGEGILKIMNPSYTTPKNAPAQ